MDKHILLFIAAGFIAQIIDGALGMAYGVTTTTLLLSFGIPPAAVSAGVHTSEILTSGVSGISHLRFGNVDRELFKKLLIPGAIGGILGAYILTSVRGELIKPFVAVYLLLLGLSILSKAIRSTSNSKPVTRIFPLAVIGGFCDSVGGGGWGPIVTSTLVAGGNSPRYTIGSVNLAEFFVSLVQAGTFIVLIGMLQWQTTGRIIIGLVIGGVIAAPFAAFICQHIPRRTLMFAVALLIIVLSVRTICLAF
ncbi:MAG: sulfite exporter TauE/SafE family protein [Blastocatellia bacterium]|nr:sulfite exporter TauE/SafE family protein [Blastocatellia bacterium]